MNDAEVRLITLPLPTSRTVTGPELVVARDEAIVRYDFERDDGSVAWVRITFARPIAVSFRTEPACRATDLDAYVHLTGYAESEWLSDVQSRVAGYFGSDGQPALIHWRLYFDDAGCIEAIASDDAVTVNAED